MIPHWFHFLLLALIAFRIFRLLAEDDVLNRPRKWLLQLNKNDEPSEDREYIALFLVCPWCAGFWISGLVYLAWFWTFGHYDTPSDIAVGVGVWFAISAVVGLTRKNLDEPEE